MARKRKSYPELEALRHLLGKVPDHEVAARAGTSASIVGRYRRSLKIDAYDGYKFGASEEEEAAAAAEAAKAPAKPAKAKAKAKAAKPAATKAKTTKAKATKAKTTKAKATKPATKAAASKAAKAPKAAATKAKASKAASTKAKATKAKAPRATAKADAAPKTAKTPGRRSKITPFHDQVGTLPDKEVADLAGVSTEAVRMYRRRRGIELTLEKKVETKKKRNPSRRRSRLDPYFDELGRVPDAEIAAKAGVTPENVRAYRTRHGIKADYRKKTRGPGRPKAAAAVAAAPKAPAVAAPAPVVKAPAPAPAVVEAPPVAAPAKPAAVKEAAAETTLQAYSVTAAGSDETWVLFATDVAKAAVRAMGALAELAPGARIGSITHLGHALP